MIQHSDCQSKFIILSRMLVPRKMADPVNSLMFAGIKVCVFETKPCSQGLIFAVRSCLVNYLIHELCLQVFIFAI